jgi:hypothetical protein
MGIVSHEAYLAAHEEVNTMEDVERIVREGRSGFSFEALLSILSQKMLVTTKKNVGRLRKPETARQQLERVLRGGSLLQLAADASVPPTILARVVLEAHLGVRKGTTKGRSVGKLLKSPADIEHPVLRREVEAAVENDPHAGPHVDTVRRLVGLEYEELLQQKLRAFGVPFLTEEELRERGDAKTPDALLPVPLLVRGRVVNWIDSKATFGDPTSHSQYHSNQFSSYLNRFDAGLVIYWHGFDEAVDSDPRVLLLDDLRPAECHLMTVMPQHSVNPLKPERAPSNPPSPGLEDLAGPSTPMITAHKSFSRTEANVAWPGLSGSETDSDDELFPAHPRMADLDRVAWDS